MDKVGKSPLETIYKSVPSQYVDKLFEFRTTHPVRTRVVGGVEWQYLLSGEAEETVLILGGAMSTAETSRSLIQSLEKDYCVLAPAYPVYERLGEFLDDLVGLLELEGIQQTHIFGHSLGAGVAHAFIRRYPNRIDRLVLSSFGLYNEQHLRQAKRAVRLFRLLPYGFVSGYYKRRMPKLLAGVDEEEKLFWLAYMNDVLDLQLDKNTLMSQFRLLEDMFENPDVYRIYESIESKDVLILQAKDDTGFDPGEQGDLRGTYPNASVHIFEEGGHLTRSAHREEYDAVLHEFLKSNEV